MFRHKRALSYPVDLEAERAFISAFLNGNYRMDGYHALSCNYFFAPEHRIIIYAIMELDSGSILISREELIRQLEKTGEMSPAVRSALDAVTDKLISEGEINIVRDRIIDCSICRSLVDRLSNTTCWLADGDIGSEKLLQWTHDCLLELHNGKEFLPLYPKD